MSAEHVRNQKKKYFGKKEGPNGPNSAVEVN